MHKICSQDVSKSSWQLMLNATGPTNPPGLERVELPEDGPRHVEDDGAAAEVSAIAAPVQEAAQLGELRHEDVGVHHDGDGGFVTLDDGLTLVLKG